MFKGIIRWGWYPTLITGLAVAGLIYRWSLEIMVPTLVLILGIGLGVTGINARQKQLDIAAVKIRQLSDYFYRRFMGNSSLSIFAIINTLFNQDTPKLWEWARSCDISQRIFNSWVSSFLSRDESNIKNSQAAAYLGNYLNELWSIVNHYYDFVEQFSEVASTYELPRETMDQYGKFTMEYNAFVQDLRSNISELRETIKTGIDPPSVKFAPETGKSLNKGVQ